MGIEWRQDAIGALHERDRRVRRIDGAEVVPEHVVGDLGEGPGQLHAGGPAAHDHERQPAPARFVVRGALRRLEREKDAAADLDGVLDGLESRRAGAPLLVTEVAVARAGGHHQGVVVDGAVFQDDPAVLRVDVAHLGEQDLGVGLPAQDGAQGPGDVRVREIPRGHLVEERLEQVEVAPVQEGDPDGGVAQGLGRGQPAEAAAHNDDVVRGSRFRRCRGAHGPRTPFSRRRAIPPVS